jgi:hypothetical protein
MTPLFPEQREQTIGRLVSWQRSQVIANTFNYNIRTPEYPNIFLK